MSRMEPISPQLRVETPRPGAVRPAAAADQGGGAFGVGLLRRQAGAVRRVARHAGEVGDGADRPVGLREVDLPAHDQPDERHHPELPRDGRGPDRRAGRECARRRSRCCCGRRWAWCSRSRTRFPKSIFENVAYGVRLHGLAESKAEMQQIVETSLRKAGLWDEVKDRLNAAGHEPVGRPAAASGHRAGDRGEPRNHPDGRAVLGAGPDRHGEGGRADRRAEVELLHRHRDPLDGAGGARLAADGVLPSRASWWKPGRPKTIFTNPRESRTQDYITGRFG